MRIYRDIISSYVRQNVQYVAAAGKLSMGIVRVRQRRRRPEVS
jgi:hypothetical protein